MDGQLPVSRDTLNRHLAGLRIKDPGTASRREIRRLIDVLESATGIRFIRMEMGIPGLPTPDIAVKEEVAALNEGVSASYPPAAGLPGLKAEMARFARLFMDISVRPEGCLPTVGSLNGSFLTLLVASSLHAEKDTVLFLDPGFPVHRQQARVLGLMERGLDLAECRGEALRTALEEACRDGRVCALLYSNPNNPTWMCLSEQELEIIANVAQLHDILVMEDLAYFAMDFRSDLGHPGTAPFQPTIARFTHEYVVLFSSSKAFSYAGQRVGMVIVSDDLFPREFPHLGARFPFTRFGDALVLGALYAASAGVTHSAQRGLAALLRAANDGEFDFREHVRVYGVRAHAMKRTFTDNGFAIVYDNDLGQPLADGFYFTVGWPGLSGRQLVGELLRYGISAISLEGTGARRTEGIRACVSLVREDQLPDLDRRLKLFAAEHARTAVPGAPLKRAT